VSLAPLSTWFRALFGTAAPATPAAAPLPPPAAPFDFTDPRIPATSRERLAVIAGLLDDLVAAANGTGVSETQSEVAKIRATYLPDLMASYFAIPAEHRAEIFRATGRSASFQLNERLDRLIDRLREMSRAAAQSPLDDFSARLGFIDSRFGGASETFEWRVD